MPVECYNSRPMDDITLDEHLRRMRRKRWQGKSKLWIQAGRLTALPLCDQGTRLAQNWTAQLRRARALRGGSAPKQS